MPELDDAQIRTAITQVADAAAAEVDLDARLAELHARTAKGGHGRRWGTGLLAAAAAVALVAGSMAVFGGPDGDQRVHTVPAPGVLTHDPDAKEALDRAVAATMDASGWVAEITSGGGGHSRFTYQHPNRVDSDTFDSDGNRVDRLIVIGTDAWSPDDGVWTPYQHDWRDVFPITALDALDTACAVRTDDGLLAWRDDGDCDRPLDPDASDTDVWRVELDAGRVSTIETFNGMLDPEAVRPGLNRAARLPDAARFRASFRYDHVPAVDAPGTGPPSTPEAPSDAEALAYDAFDALGWEPEGQGLLAPGATGAAFYMRIGDAIVPVAGSPVQDLTFDHNGEPEVFVLDNDHITDAHTVELGDAPGVAGTADGYPFAAFTCGGYLWTVGGLLGADWPVRIEGDLAISVAADLAAVLGCEPGDRPVAPGHGDPHG